MAAHEAPGPAPPDSLVRVGIWATTGRGYFRPGWVMGIWAVGLVLHAWNVFVQRPITSADIDREVQRLKGSSPDARA